MTLMVTSSVQHDKHTKPLRLPLVMTIDITLANDTKRHTRDAINVRLVSL